MNKLKIFEVADNIVELDELVRNLYPELLKDDHKIIGLREDGENSIVCYVTDEDELEFHLVCFKFEGNTLALDDHSERYT